MKRDSPSKSAEVSKASASEVRPRGRSLSVEGAEPSDTIVSGARDDARRQRRRRGGRRAGKEFAAQMRMSSRERGAMNAAKTALCKAREPDHLDVPALLAGLQEVASRGGKQALLTQEQERSLGTRVQALRALEELRESMIESALATEITESANKGIAGLMPTRREPTDADLAHAAGLSSVAEMKHIISRGEEARELLVQANLGLVGSVARKYMFGHDMSLEDLMQEGCVGLMKSAERFDPSRGYKFSTYAYHWVRQGVTRAIFDMGRTIRIPVYLHEQQNQMMKAEREFMKTHGRNPTDAELATVAGVTEQRVMDVRHWTTVPVSLDKTIGTSSSGDSKELVDDAILFDSNTSGSAERVEEDVEADFLKMDLEDLLETLLPREKYILRLRYGLDGDRRFKTLREIAEMLGVVDETVRGYEMRGLRKLRHPQRAGYLLPYLSGDDVDDGDTPLLHS